MTIKKSSLGVCLDLNFLDPLSFALLFKSLSVKLSPKDLFLSDLLLIDSDWTLFFLIFLFFFAILFSSHDEHESTSLNTRFLLFLVLFSFSFNNNESRNVFSVITSPPIRLTLFVGFFDELYQYEAD